VRGGTLAPVAHQHLHETLPTHRPRLVLVEAKDTRAAEVQVAAIRTRVTEKFVDAIDGYHAAIEAGTPPATAAARMVEGFHKALDDGYEASHARGRAVWGGRGGSGLSDRATRELRRQKQFAFRFGIDIAKGVPAAPGRMNSASRAALYGNAMEGAFQLGAVDGSPDGQLIWWRLGAADHCIDCPVLAINSPYTRGSLPTWPRAGETTCRQWCACHLEFRTVKRKPSDEERRRREREALDLESVVQGNVPAAPPGLSLPDARQQAAIRDLEHRIAHANRKIDAAATKAERRRWIDERRDANKRLIDFQDEHKVWSPPAISTGEALSGLDVRATDVHWLTHVRGIDGRTVSRATIEAREVALAAAKADLASMAAKLPAGGELPALGDLLKFGEALVPDAPPGIPEVEPEQGEGPSPGETIVVQVVGRGAIETVRAAYVALQAMPGLDVQVGPLAEDWPEQVVTAGLWVQGREAEVERLLAAVAKGVGRDGLGVARWHA